MEKAPMADPHDSLIKDLQNAINSGNTDRAVELAKTLGKLGVQIECSFQSEEDKS